ncbi:MAG TPA: tetratricopeptide repeat protein [Methylomirabilota bacterium]|nr:tetratricopeptide repeat protein [Methylomirabilota bacterium]
MPHRTLVARVALVALLLPTAAAHAQKPPQKASKPPAKQPARPDSALPESPPGPLIVTPKAPPPAPEDTALAGARRRARQAYARGIALERQGAYAAAIVSYTEAARTDPTLRGPSFRVGELFAWKHQWDPAARAYREELHRDPDSRDAAREYALMLVELGDTTRPVRMLEELTRRDANDSKAWRALGFAYARLGRLDDAERAIRGSIALDAKSAAAWRDLGVIYAERGDERGARDAYRRALAIDPNELPTIINLANLEGRSGNHEAALARYREAAQRDSTYLDAYRGQIRELVVLGREEDAGAVWKRWLAVAPDDEVREGAARHYVRQGRTDIAMEIARNAVRDAPRAGEPRWLLGEVQLAAGDTVAALGSYRDAWMRYKQTSDRARAEASIAALRAAARSDTLRARLAADSMRYARADTTNVGAR